MQSEDVVATVSILGTDYRVQSLNMGKKIGQLARGSAQINPSGSMFQSIGEADVESMAKDFNETILNKDDANPNVSASIAVSGTTVGSFSGILTSCNATISGEGSSSFSVSFAEVNYVLNSMSFSAYPSGAVEMVGALSRSNARHPYTRLTTTSGDIAQRIKQLYQTAKTHASKLSQDNPVDKVMAQHREANKKYEEVFNSLLDRSDMNPAWLDSVSTQVSMQIDDTIAEILFDSRLNVWQALMRIAHQFNLIYVGGFEDGGFFTQLDVGESSCNLKGAGNSVSSRTLQLGRSLEQSIGQIIALQPLRNPSTLVGVFKDRNGSINKVAGMFPKDKPKPTTGKIIVMRAPSYFTPSIPPSEGKDDDLDGSTEEEADTTAEDLDEENKKREDAIRENSALVDRWCEDMYKIMRTRNVKYSVTKPIERAPCELGKAVTVGSFEGSLGSVTLTASISGNSGTAQTTYIVSYIQP